MNSDPNVALVATPSRPLLSSCVVVTRLPTWVPFLAGSVMRGDDGEDGTVNGISLTVDGNLMLYRKIHPSDWVMFPELLGIAEVWLELDIDPDII